MSVGCVMRDVRVETVGYRTRENCTIDEFSTDLFLLSSLHGNRFDDVAFDLNTHLNSSEKCIPFAPNDATVALRMGLRVSLIRLLLLSAFVEARTRIPSLLKCQVYALGDLQGPTSILVDKPSLEEVGTRHSSPLPSISPRSDRLPKKPVILMLDPALASPRRP